jgi:LuxR family maltose regulon positive regulatory protein
LERLRQAAEVQGQMGQVLELLVLQALASQAQGDARRAMATLSRALSLGEPEGYIRTFVDESWPGALLGELLRQAAPVTAYAGQLLAVLEGERKARDRRRLEEQARVAGPAFIRRPSSLVEPLGERELEVLRLVAAGLSNREIAQALVITTGTAKWYVNQIYNKLAVHSRTQAVARARELGLL